MPLMLSGRRDDIETVITATQKADLAFQMLLQLRNKMMGVLRVQREAHVEVVVRLEYLVRQAQHALVVEAPLVRVAA